VTKLKNNKYCNKKPTNRSKIFFFWGKFDPLTEKLFFFFFEKKAAENPNARKFAALCPFTGHKAAKIIIDDLFFFTFS
jgi:hypothetical protein